MPLLGMCERCNMQFPGGDSQLGKSSIQEQFNKHSCLLENVTHA